VQVIPQDLNLYGDRTGQIANAKGEVSIKPLAWPASPKWLLLGLRKRMQ
jgi:hypothetical protein